MKKLKKILLFGFLTFAVLCPAVFGIAKINPNPQLTSHSTTVSPTLFNLVSITKEGQILTSENLLEYNDESYIVANGSISINLSPLDQNYQVQIDEYASNFIKSTDTIVIGKDPSTGTYPESFEYNQKTYYFLITTLNQLNIYNNNPLLSTPIVSSNRTTELTFEEINDNLILTITKAYTLKSDAPDSIFKFINPSSLENYELHLLRPKVNFSNAANPIVMFNTFETDSDGNTYPPTDTITREQQFSKMQIDFINNTYTEENPLFFNINYNGFTYSFELYSQEFNSENLLFVNYVDENNTSNNKYLATGLALSSDSSFIPINDLNANSENLSLIFNNTGRYEIEIYDSSYLCGLNDANYYSTSFYVVNSNSTSFENIYMIAQTMDDSHNAIEYIVSTSTLNYDVELTIKNLTNLKSDENLSDIIDNIEVIKAIFGASNNEPIHTVYDPEEITNMIQNGNLNFFFDEDAYYEIYIYPKNSALSAKKYSFTIVKQAKTSMTIEGEKFEATEPYKTTIKDYAFNINSPVGIIVKFTSTSPTSDTILNKTYINTYQIRYGMQQVSITKVPSYDDEGNEINTSLTIAFYGVGNLTVSITFNDETTTYYLNSEESKNTLTFTEFGTYQVTMVDSMGTESAAVFTLAQQLNISAIVLIILSSIIVLAIVIFILIARSKIKTR